MSRTVVFRRPDPQQGRALEVLGHAVEYLVDSYSFRDAGEATDMQAIAILHRLSREVFSECRIVEPLGQRLRKFTLSLSERLLRRRHGKVPSVPDVVMVSTPVRLRRPSGVHKIQTIA